jgi:hypothetical protein
LARSTWGSSTAECRQRPTSGRERSRSHTGRTRDDQVGIADAIDAADAAAVETESDGLGISPVHPQQILRVVDRNNQGRLHRSVSRLRKPISSLPSGVAAKPSMLAIR